MAVKFSPDCERMYQHLAAAYGAHISFASAELPPAVLHFAAVAAAQVHLITITLMSQPFNMHRQGAELRHFSWAFLWSTGEGKCHLTRKVQGALYVRLVLGSNLLV